MGFLIWNSPPSERDSSRRSDRTPCGTSTYRRSHPQLVPIQKTREQTDLKESVPSLSKQHHHANEKNKKTDPATIAAYFTAQSSH